MPLEEVPDAVFAGRMLGDGLAIDPTSGILHAPCAGELISVAPTGHAVTLRADIGAELLMHVGIDTVALKGEGFEAQVQAGRRVEAGAPLIRFDLDLIARRAPSLVTPLLVTNGERFEIVRRLVGRAVSQGELADGAPRDRCCIAGDIFGRSAGQPACGCVCRCRMASTLGPRR